MKNIIYLMIVILVVGLASCRDLSGDDRPRKRRQDDPTGEVELPEDIMKEGFFDFSNCKPTMDGPDNTTDIFIEGIMPGKNPFKIGRNCLKDKLDKAHKHICKAREALEKQRDRAKTDSDRRRIENQMYRLDQIQWTFNNNVAKIADQLDRAVDKMDKRRSDSSNEWFNIAIYFAQEEARGQRNILEIESYTECFDSAESQY